MPQSQNNYNPPQRRDEHRLPLMTTQDKYELGPWTASEIPESSSSSCFVTDGRWFGRANVPDVADMKSTTSLVNGSPWSQSYLNLSSSSGSLVCPPAVLMSPPGEVFEDACFGNANAALLDDTYAHEANQAPRPWCGNTNVLESLVSTQCICT
ncbi:hypothetical protein F4803DRAFT_524949 [Xylaria telfairii]|nr:hypothetical protein F4803DRAFT_524949 [Xylaria telfairii]